MGAFLGLIMAFLLSLDRAQAYEVDQFTHRAQVPTRGDSLTLLDEEVRRQMGLAIEHVNERMRKRAERCVPGVADHEERVEEALERVLVGDNPVSTKFEKWVMGLPEGEVLVSTPPGQSLYAADRKYSLIVLTGMIVPEILVAGQRVGTDKIGHFVQLGYRLHRKLRRERVAAGGCRALVDRSSELGYYGCTSGGFVYAYGDMAANLAGIVFWDRVVGVGGDSYIVCGADGRYQLNPSCKPFSFAEYVNPLWDEAINCSMDCQARDRFRPSRNVTVTAQVGRYGCPWREARAPWGGTELSGPEFCAKVREAHAAGVRLGVPGESIQGASCLEEIVSPACLKPFRLDPVPESGGDSPFESLEPPEACRP